MQNEDMISVIYDETGATFYIPSTQEYLDYYCDIVYDVVKDMIVNGFDEAIEMYTFIGKF